MTFSQNRLTSIRRPLLFSATIAAILFGSGILSIIGLRPQSIHQWRQCDSASQALNYYQNNISFWTPQMHTQTGKNGFAASEFPIIYYLVAQFYKLFGFHEYIFRLVNLTLFIAALAALFLTAGLFISNPWLSLIPVVVIGTSPYVFYYANNFLPNVPAISLAIIGWCFFCVYLKSGARINLILSFFFFTLGSLIKISEAISLVAASIVIVTGRLNLFSLHSTSQTWRKNIILKFALMALSVAILAAWNIYAMWFNKINGTGQNLLGTIPIWNMTSQAIRDTKDRFRIEWSRVIFDRWIWYALGAHLLVFLIFFRRMNPLLRLVTLLMFLGVTCYVLLWFEAFYHHDYYMLTFIMFPIFLMLSCFEYFARTNTLQSFVNKAGNIRKAFFFIAFVTFTSVLISYNHRHQHRRYFKMQPSVNAALYSIEPYLRAIGVKRTDLVVSVPDRSPNISLYLMNNPGWTEAFNSEQYNINYFINSGARYLVVSDSSYLNNPLYTPFTTHQIGAYHGVNIYSLDNTRR